LGPACGGGTVPGVTTCSPSWMAAIAVYSGIVTIVMIINVIPIVIEGSSLDAITGTIDTLDFTTIDIIYLSLAN
jgi:hypothetical protein